MLRKDFDLVVGLEVHAQLNTRTKLFSSASTAYGAEPNTQVSYIDLAMPGTLPVLNKEAVRMAVLFGLSIRAKITPQTVFARKHYFYPDLPKGYQISQHHHPIVGAGGYLTIKTEAGRVKTVRIARAHLEEDAGKLIHDKLQTIIQEPLTGIDFNRAGVPLLEIVTEPDLRSAQEAVVFLKHLHRLVRYLKICDGNMQEGSFRCDVNVSVRARGETALGVRSEIKNLNSFKAVEGAIEAEEARQIEAISKGCTLISETRSFDPVHQQTTALREKETEADYRYMPDPDLCPLTLSEAFIEELRGQLPELSEAKRDRLKKQYQLSDYDTEFLIANLKNADYFELIVAAGITPKVAVNWMAGELSAVLNKENLEVDQTKITAQQLADLLKRLSDGTISRATAKVIFERLWEGPVDIDAFVQKKNLAQISDERLMQAMIDRILEQYPEQLHSYKMGKVKLFGFFVGQVMQLAKGRCNPKVLDKLLQQALNG